ncbi:hypothetical protein [Pseudomonas synxantha]|uniref:hypothetical protein n=1 Tax=Pseudomonas synxantha TaxID=47883 RepID=UPI000F561BD1|nr:hypothetical protein [Pseudomonas synxantha]AZE76132.1 hypothetical protein C4J99_0315 [Pseudomonas synxantha]
MQLIDILNLISKVVEKSLSTEVFIALVAAYIGARATSKATTKAHNFSIEKSKSDNLENTQNTLKLIKAELTSAWDIYYSEYGSDLLQLLEGEACVDVFPIGDNPFPIYDSAPSSLANIDPAISANIVRIYMRVKGLISMININNADCQTIYDAGRNATQKLANKFIAEGKELNEELAKKLEEYHDYYAHQEAKKLRMDRTAYSMKLLTIELQNSLAIAVADIDRLTATTSH